MVACENIDTARLHEQTFSTWAFCDISSYLKGRGFPFSRMGFPVSWDIAHKSWTWVSYTSSTGLTFPEPQGRSGMIFRPLHSYSNRCAGNWKGRQAKSISMPLPSDLPFIPRSKERGLLARGVINGVGSAFVTTSNLLQTARTLKACHFVPFQTVTTTGFSKQLFTS